MSTSCMVDSFFFFYREEQLKIVTSIMITAATVLITAC